jgi:hypothetical protein
MSDWLVDVIGNNLITVYEGLDATVDALIWLREKPRTFGELRCVQRTSIGCGGWLPTSKTRIYWRNCHRIPIPMSACEWRAIL